jgi:hypothetical protein
MSNVIIIKALCGLASPGYDNPRPAAVWLRLPALMVLANFTPWSVEAKAKVKVKTSKLPTPRGEADAEEAFQATYGFKAADARFTSRFDRRMTVKKPKYKK